jgi:choline-sulfatase
MTNNLLVIMSDEHQARAMGCAGHPFVQTPNLDALAARGTRFTNAYTPCPICVPARAAFATGRPVHEIGLWDNAMPYDGSVPGWGHALQTKDVPVESIGKLHYRAEEDPAGFDVEHLPMMVVGGVGMVWASIRKEDERVSGRSRMLGDYIGPGDSNYTRYDQRVTDRTCDWLAEHAGDARPWCLYVGLVAPHFPFVAPEEYFDLYPPGTVPEPKLHPSKGYTRHPWIEKQNAMFDSEAQFKDPDERLRALTAYYALCSMMDANVGRILEALDAAGLSQNTTVAYTSDHGDNVGARGLWGKSNFYEESAAVPLIVARPGQKAQTCNTAVSLLDLSSTIADHFGAALDGPGQPLGKIAAAPPDPDREVFSEYHAAGAVSGGFMLRKGRWKYIHYVGFAPELFDLEADPEETNDLADSPDHTNVIQTMETALRAHCDPEATDARAFADQAAMIERYGGRDAALQMGAPGATPPPES